MKCSHHLATKQPKQLRSYHISALKKGDSNQQVFMAMRVCAWAF
nr:MAG TPA: hypothetical protein [Caudoviricetes sp.]